MRNLVLTGFMGTGKSTVGRILAYTYGLPFVDCDEELERRAGCTIAEFWERHEEPAFRDLEAEVFAGIMARPARQIVATGGGTLTFERNRSVLHSNDTVITLNCSVEELCRRLGQERASRPLLAGADDGGVAASIAHRLGQRRPTYDLFTQVDTTSSAPEDVAAKIAGLVDLETETLRFDATRTTSIVFRRGASCDLASTLDRAGITGRALAVTDDCVASLPGPRRAMQSLVGSRTAPDPVVLPIGEAHKTSESVHEIYRACRTAGLERSSTLLGIGGGVIGDVAGFAAATYMRGIRLVLVPTTLLAQVDASIGGKVGIDFDGVKNLVGAFHPAELVIIDPDLLETLPDAALSGGLAEIVKIAAVCSAELLERVESLQSPRDILHAPDIIRSAAALKARIVERDPYEQGERALLNFGHTVGHAVEAASAYVLSHGHAVSAGMVAETWLAERLGLADAGILARLTDTLERLQLPRRSPAVDLDVAVAAMASDKKRLNGAVRFALPASPGQGRVVRASAEDARAALAYALGEQA